MMNFNGNQNMDSWKSGQSTECQEHSHESQVEFMERFGLRSVQVDIFFPRKFIRALGTLKKGFYETNPTMAHLLQITTKSVTTIELPTDVSEIIIQFQRRLNEQEHKYYTSVVTKYLSELLASNEIDGTRLRFEQVAWMC